MFAEASRLFVASPKPFAGFIFTASTHPPYAWLDDRFQKYLASYDRTERKQLAEQIQRTILEEYYLVPVFRHAFVNAYGPRIAAKQWRDLFPTLTTGYCYPWEDIKLKTAAAAR